MKVWVCENCGCEIKEDKPRICPLCNSPTEKFFDAEIPDPDTEDEEFTKKYDEVIEQLEEYTKDCEPEDPKYYFEE